MSYIFHLEVYRNTSQKHHCPNCGKKTFVRYVDDEGNYIADEVGRCDRENSCAYHLSPREYFVQHPELKDYYYQKKHNVKKEPEPPRPIDYIPINYVEAATNDKFLQRNNLFIFFQEEFGKESAQHVFAKYHVGSSKHWRDKDYGLATAFPQIDVAGNVCQMKIMMYDAGVGKRLHDDSMVCTWSPETNDYYFDNMGSKVLFMGKTIMRMEGVTDPNLQQTFFGAHLIPAAKTVCIVESEKTAMIADMCMGNPDTAWVATGGMYGCKWTTWEVCQVLQGKNVMLFPDLQCYEDWAKRADSLRSFGINAVASKYIEEHCTDEERKQGLDIADYLIRMNRFMLQPFLKYNSNS